MNLKKSFKKQLTPLLTFIVSNKVTWNMSMFFLIIGNWMHFQRSQYEREIAEEKLKIYFGDKIVKNGFFKGMKYSQFKAAGSSLFPKLLGSYEIELYPIFLKFQHKRYDNILDIGCAEGYYAVGLAMKFPDSKIYGYDIDKDALRLCEDLARKNHVEERVFLNDVCNASTLESFNYSERSLIICDCEGYEQELFTATNIHKLQSVDLIIELHPFAVKDIKEYLIDLFLNTHHLNIISSLDNNRKIFDFKFSLKGLNQLEQLISIEEGRPFTMEWLIAESKFNSI